MMNHIICAMPKKLPMFGLALSYMLMFGAFSNVSWAGGVVEEFNVAPNALISQTDTKQGSTSHHVTGHKDVKEAPQQATPHANPNQSKGSPNLVTLYYDPIHNRTVLRWRAAIHQGQEAIQYNIYRWTAKNPKRELLARVGGDVFEYTDSNLQIDIKYRYNIVGIYRINGAYQAWQYPNLQQIGKTKGNAYTPPSSAMGCQIDPSTPSSPLWLLLLLLPLFISTRRAKATRV